MVGPDSSLAKLHRVVLVNDVEDAFAAAKCNAMLAIPDQGDATFGFGQFSLSEPDDRNFLLDLMLESQPDNFGPKTRGVLQREGPFTNLDRDVIRQAEDAIRVRLLSSKIRARFLSAYRNRLEQRLSGVDRLYRSMVASNDALGKGRVSEFIRLYAVDAMRLLGDLDDFTDLIEKKQPYVCNLLCQARLLPAFRIAERATALDLPRYIHSATCFGYARAVRSIDQFVRRFENIVRESGVTPDDLLPGDQQIGKVTQFDLFFALYDLHDLDVISGGTADRLQDLKQRARALLKGDKDPVGRRVLQEAVLVKAAADACEKARGPGWQQVRQVQ